MTPNDDKMPGSPEPESRGIEAGEVRGDVIYHISMPPAKYRGPLLPGGDLEDLPPRPGLGEYLRRSRRLPPTTTRLVPTTDEVAGLPRLAREAFADRCARRLPPGAAGPADAAATARALLEAATLDTPLTAQLRCIRRDFARLKRLARKQNWTDDTPVPPEVFGPLWPPGVAPPWAAEPASGGT